MRTLTAILRRVARRAAMIVVLALAITSAMTDAAWAAKPPHVGLTEQVAAGPGGKSYLIPYAIVVLCMAFGLVVAFRPSTREATERVKAKDEPQD